MPVPKLVGTLGGIQSLRRLRRVYFLSRADLADNLVERSMMVNGAVDEFAVDIIWQDDLLCRTRFLFRPLHQPWCPFLEEMKDFRGNLNNVLIHL